jgi:hypothetical protein
MDTKIRGCRSCGLYSKSMVWVVNRGRFVRKISHKKVIEIWRFAVYCVLGCFVGLRVNLLYRVKPDDTMVRPALGMN